MTILAILTAFIIGIAIGSDPRRTLTQDRILQAKPNANEFRFICRIAGLAEPSPKQGRF